MSQHTSRHREAPYAIEHFLAPELGNSSYLIADRDSRAAAVIDPVRDVEQYVRCARGHGWTLAYALDTHVHNDFLSGGAELAGAGHGAYVAPAGGSRVADTVAGGRVLALGSLRLRALHTPGHTPEHVSYLLESDSATPVLFSGGALMVGTIARPDLLGPDHTFSLARMAHDTVRTLASLGDGVAVLPTHGAGSFCGAASSDDRTTSVGRERRDNALMREPSFLDFLARYANQGEYPRYYADMAPLNRAGVPRLGLPLPALRHLAADDVTRLLAQGAVLVDVRSHASFDSGFIAGSLNAGADGPMSAWLGWLLPLGQRYTLVADDASQADSARRMLVRIGMDALAGWTTIDDWTRDGGALSRMRRGDMSELARRIEAGERLAVLDVRQEREWLRGHVPGAVHALAPVVTEVAGTLREGTLVAVYCSSGYRSALAASLLARDTRVQPWHLADSVEQWQALGLPLTVPG